MFCDLELHGHSDIFSLVLTESGWGTSSTTNHKFDKALGQLHGPWCEQSLAYLESHNAAISYSRN